MSATSWDVLGRTDFKSRWGSNSVAVPLVYLAMLSLRLWIAPGDQVNRDNLPFARHAANEYEGWVTIVKRFTLSHKTIGLTSVN